MVARNTENYEVIKTHDPDSRYGPDVGEETESLNDMEKKRRDNDLELHKKLLEWYTQEREVQALTRYQRGIDDDYYDHLQWSEEDAQEVRSRGQSPNVFNEIKPVIDWILGTERRMRTDSVVLPREEEDVDGARIKTKLMKYLSDVNKTVFNDSRAFSDAVKSGLGWLEDGIDTEPGKELLQSRYEDWRYMLHDSKSREDDMSDARYIFRWRWLDTDIAQGYFPDKAAELKQASIAADLNLYENDEDFYYLGQHFQTRDRDGEVITRRTFVSDAYHFNRRNRVKIIECWYYKIANVCLCRGGKHDGLEYDSSNKNMETEKTKGVMETVDMVRLQMQVGIFTEGHLLYSDKSPYRHNRFPFTPIWGFRRKRDNAPYGVIRGQRDAQDDLNKRFSKTLFLLSVNRIIADDDAVEDWEELAEEAAAPNSIIKKKRGSDLKIETNIEISKAQIDLMERDRRFVQNASGVTGENLGLETNATSGIAIQAKQEQGSVTTTPLFDNLRLAKLLRGEKQLSLIEQFYTDKKTIRITGKKGKPEYSTINEWDEEREEYLNDITAAQADYVIGEQKYQQTLRLAMFETLSNLIPALPPELSMKILPLVFEFMDLPEKDDIIAEIKKATGQISDEDMNDEEKAAAEKQAQAEATMVALEKRIKAAEASLKESDALLKQVKSREAAVSTAKEVITTEQAGQVAADIIEESQAVITGPEQGLQRPNDMVSQDAPPEQDMEVPQVDENDIPPGGMPDGVV